MTRAKGILASIFLCQLLFLGFEAYTPLALWAQESREIRDNLGNNYTIPTKVERVAPLIGAFVQITEMLTLGSGKVVAYPKGNVSDYFLEVFPDLILSNPNRYDSSSVEEIISSGAQVAYGPDGRLSDVEKSQLNAASIAVVPINGLATVAELSESFLLIGEILGPEEKERAEAFVEYYRESLAWPYSRVKDVPKSQRPKVLVLNIAGGAWGTINKNDICHEYITNAGGINLAADYLATGGGMNLRLDPESVILWDPELILTYSNESKSEILNNAALQNVRAVKDKRVFTVPYGIYLWSVRSGEGAMMTPWLGTVFYPQLFSDVDMMELLRDFYLRFYKHEPSDEELKSILAGSKNINAGGPSQK
ncbi:MAG: ABC transporter substrate-binding protein [Deltaproteobacteria bacterium]|jgi:iron complex transport system substrate-binding protein|nr:ABC transporter substrate-binding protein [Deltaproteobacteria bacterium]